MLPDNVIQGFQEFYGNGEKHVMGFSSGLTSAFFLQPIPSCLCADFLKMRRFTFIQKKSMVEKI